MTKARRSEELDSYIAQFPVKVQKILTKVRQTIGRAAPEATETISYQMPAFKQHGILVYFAAWKEHIGLYPPISGDKALEKAVALCRSEGQFAISPGRANSLRLDRTHRQAAREAGRSKSGGEEEKEVVGLAGGEWSGGVME